MTEFKSFYKTASGEEGTRCLYPDRLDLYGCGCFHDCSYCYAKSLLDFRNLWDADNPSEARIEAVRKVEEITGIKVTMLEPPPEKNFDYLMFDHVLTKGPRKGTKGYGWPNALNRWCTTFCKARVIDGYLREIAKTHDIVQYIGIAADEEHRAAKEGGIDCYEKRFPLIDWGMTEADCLQFCYDHGIDWGGLYNHYTRISCWCCPLMRMNDARNLYHFYPEKWEKLKEMDARCRNQFKPNYSVLDLEAKFKKEDEDAAARD